MSFVPTLCVECWRVSLLSLSDAQRGAPTCKCCGADVRIVPGCSYGESDREHFEELSDIMVEAAVTPAEARDHATAAQRALWSGAYSELLERLCVRLPGLVPMQAAAGKNSGAQRKILVKLQTMFDALATARRESAEYPVMGSSSLRHIERR